MKLAALAFSIAMLSTPPLGLAQGSLTPPAGPPAPVMKTLDQVKAGVALEEFPFTISEPGHYFLTGNVSHAAGIAISVESENVSIDLGGFTIDGGGTATSAIATTVAAVRGLAISNGTVRGFTSSGIEASNTAYVDVENVFVFACGGTGAVVTNGWGRISNSSFRTNNGGAALRVGPHTIINGCVVNNNNSNGIVATGASAVISNTTVNGNTGIGIDAQQHSLISNTVVFLSGGNGINIISGTVRTSNVSNCGNNGIVASYSTLISDNSIESNDQHGIVVGSNCRVTGNLVTDSGDAVGVTDGTGIVVTAGSERSYIANNSLVDNDRGIMTSGPSDRIVAKENNVSGAMPITLVGANSQNIDNIIH